MAPDLNKPNVAIPVVRWLLGIQSLASGINWWFKILPFPNMHEHITGPVKHEILRVLIESGWMFSTAKMLEILLGLALIFNRHAVLALVLSFPVILMTFLLDLFPFLTNIAVFLAGDLSGRVLFSSFLDMLYFGAGVFVMQSYLMSEYFRDYRPLFAVKPGGEAPAWSGLMEARGLKLVLRWLSFTVGATSTLWVVGMALRVLPWTSLTVLAPPH
jgi:hypothetical protein